jgi:hypothetical protein
LPASVALPTGGVVDDAGAVVDDADVVVSLFPLPVIVGGRRNSEALLAFPGDMSAVDTAAGDVFLESLGAMEVRLTHRDTGAALNLGPAQTATLTFPASLDVIVEDEIRGWFFDTEAGVWVEEGTGTLDVDATGTLVVRMEVEHFTWWNADRPVDRTCVRGRAVDEAGAALPGTGVFTFGLDYLGKSNSTSGGDGIFEVFARPSSQVRLTAAARIGGVVVSPPAIEVRTGAVVDGCVDVGDIAIDTSVARGCLRGVVENGATNQPADGIEVAAFGRDFLVTARTGADGAFCVGASVGQVVDLSFGGVDQNTSAPVLGFLARNSTASPGACSDLPSCQNVGTVRAVAQGCIAGDVVNDLGGVANAIVIADGRTSLRSTRSAADGAYCVDVAASDVVDLVGRGPGDAFRAVGERRNILAGGITSSCANPETCAAADIVLGDVGCMRGVTLDEAGAPLPGVTVTAVPEFGGVARSVGSGTDGTFCVPVRLDEDMVLSFDKRVGDTRLYARGLFGGSSGEAASCSADGGSSCDDIGDITLAATSGAGCFRGTALVDGVPYNDIAIVEVEDVRAALRPRDDGSFCVDIIAGGARVEDGIRREGCSSVGSTSVTVESTSNACANEASCTDVGVLDFATFCSGS